MEQIVGKFRPRIESVGVSGTIHIDLNYSVEIAGLDQILFTYFETYSYITQHFVIRVVEVHYHINTFGMLIYQFITFVQLQCRLHVF